MEISFYSNLLREKHQTCYMESGVSFFFPKYVDQFFSWKVSFEDFTLSRQIWVSSQHNKSWLMGGRILGKVIVLRKSKWRTNANGKWGCSVMQQKSHCSFVVCWNFGKKVRVTLRLEKMTKFGWAEAENSSCKSKCGKYSSLLYYQWNIQAPIFANHSTNYPCH